MKKLLVAFGSLVLAVIVYGQSSSGPFYPPSGGGGSTSYIIPASSGGGSGGGTVTTINATAPIAASTGDAGVTYDLSFIGTTLFTFNAGGGTNINASSLSSGTVPYARLPTGSTTNVTGSTGFTLTQPTTGTFNITNDGTLVTTSRSISTTAPLAGGGDLSANRTFTFDGTTANINLSGASNLNYSTTGTGTLPYARLVTGVATNFVLTGNGAVNATSTFSAGVQTVTWSNKVLNVTATNNFQLDRSVYKIANISLTNNPTIQMAVNAQDGDVTLYRFKATNISNVVSTAVGMMSPTNAAWSFPYTISSNCYVNVLTIKAGSFAHVLTVSGIYTNAGW